MKLIAGDCRGVTFDSSPSITARRLGPALMHVILRIGDLPTRPVLDGGYIPKRTPLNVFQYSESNLRSTGDHPDAWRPRGFCHRPNSDRSDDEMASRSDTAAICHGRERHKTTNEHLEKPENPLAHSIGSYRRDDRRLLRIGAVSLHSSLPTIVNRQ